MNPLYNINQSHTAKSCSKSNTTYCMWCRETKKWTNGLLS